MSLLAALVLSTSAALAMPGPCGTLALLPAVRPPSPRVGVRSIADGKATRDLFAVPNSRESSNFVLRWGNGGAVRDADLEAMLTALERSWTVQVEDMAHPPPIAADTHKINVYVGDTGDGAPPGYGAAGYYTPDAEGYPMIVLAQETVAAPEDGVLTAAHEFYHAVQWATGSYDYGEGAVGAWYWEATASWIEAEVYPGNPEYAVFLFGYALLPQLPVDFFDYPDTGALQEYHQYGAFIFPQYLSEFEGGPALVRDSWVTPQAGSRDPLVNLDAALRASGTDLGSAFSAFAARNATWDYRDGEAYSSFVETYGAYFPAEDGGVGARESLSSGDDLGWRTVRPGRLPERFGYTLIEVTVEDPLGVLGVDLVADPVGSSGSDSAWGVSVVTLQGGTRTYHRARLDETGSASLDLAVAEGTTVWLVAAAWAESRVPGETFSWSYRLRDATPAGTDGDGVTEDSAAKPDTAEETGSGGPGAASWSGTEPEKGCRGCGTGTAPAGRGLWFAGLLLGVGRRRW